MYRSAALPLLLALAALPAAAQSVPVAAPVPAPEQAHVDIVFCIDRSGSMSEVIETAKRKVWSIISEVGRSKPTPVLRIGLIGYGSADREFKMFPLTDDLDLVYKNLFTFATDMGGDEWVGLAVKKAADEMAWSTGKTVLKTIFVVGNETAAQGQPDVQYTKTVPEAIRKDIIVNAIYCGKPSAEEEKTWMEVAKLADGVYTIIDLSGGAVTIATPFDKALVDVNNRLNATYIAFGARGGAGKKSQEAQDANTHQSGGASNLADRAQAKGSALYRNASWDLVDASLEKDFKWESLKAEELPEEMRKMSVDQRKAHVEKKRKEREAVQKEIQEIAVKRQKFIDAEMKAKNLTQDSAFDEAVRKAVREQAVRRGFKFE